VLCNMYSLPIIIRVTRSRRLRFVANLVHMGNMSNAYKVLVSKYDGKRPLV
jgi:hypothetical protein